MDPFPALLLLLALTGSCIAGEVLEMVRRVQGGALTAVCQYDKHKYSQREKFWCKEVSNSECHTIARSSPRRNNLTTPPYARARLQDSETGWISVSMMDLRVEDSGIYWCGVSDQWKIISLKKIKLAVSYEAPMSLSAKRGNTISLNCCFVMDASKTPDNFTWCKMVTATRCQPVISVEFSQIVNTQGRTRIKIDGQNRAITVTLVELQLHDSGDYYCKAHLQGSTVLLKMVTLNILDSYNRMVSVATYHPDDDQGNILPPVDRNDEQSWYPEASVTVLYIMAGWFITKFMAALLIFIITCRRRSRALGQEAHSQNKHQLHPLTGLKKRKESICKSKMRWKDEEK